MAYVIVATWQARPGRKAEVAETIAELTRASRAEVGCRFYQGQESIEKEDEFLIYEVYDDAAAAEAHMNSEHFWRLVVERAPELLVSRGRRLFETIGT